MSDLLSLLNGQPRSGSAAETEGDTIPVDLTNPMGGGGLNIAMLAGLAAVYFLFIAKKKNKTYGMVAALIWAYASGILANLMGTGAV